VVALLVAPAPRSRARRIDEGRATETPPAAAVDAALARTATARRGGRGGAGVGARGGASGRQTGQAGRRLA
jgi:hypothetical protein